MAHAFIIVALMSSGLMATHTREIVQGEEIRERVRAFVMARLAETDEEGEVSFRGAVEDIAVPPGKAEVRVESGDGREYRGSCVVMAEILVDGKVERRLPVSMRVRTFGEVLVARQKLERHALVQEGDFERRRVETTLLRTDWVRSLEGAPPSRTKRMIGAGSVLHKSMLERVPVILRGNRVTVEVRTRGVMLSVQAIAKEDGFPGESITVQRLDAHERVKARVTGPDHVEIAAD